MFDPIISLAVYQLSTCPGSADQSHVAPAPVWPCVFMCWLPAEVWNSSEIQTNEAGSWPISQFIISILHILWTSTHMCLFVSTVCFASFLNSCLPLYSTRLILSWYWYISYQNVSALHWDQLGCILELNLTEEVSIHADVIKNMLWSHLSSGFDPLVSRCLVSAPCRCCWSWTSPTHSISQTSFTSFRPCF